jgi:hypothetical protein
VQGQICNILRPQLAMNRFLPLWPHRFPHFIYILYIWGEGAWGALILDRCRAVDLFVSVDAHLCFLLATPPLHYPPPPPPPAHPTLMCIKSIHPCPVCFQSKVCTLFPALTCSNNIRFPFFLSIFVFHSEIFNTSLF